MNALSVEPEYVFWVNFGRQYGKCLMLVSSLIRYWLLLFTFGLSCLVTAQTEKQEIIFWGQSFGSDTKGFDATIREFEKRNPQYKVRVLSMGAGNMNPQKLMTAIVGNVPPDIIFQDRFTISDWAKRNAFRPLDDLMARDKGVDPMTPDLSHYVPATVQEAVWDGKLYGIPYGSDTRILYWNRAVFRKNSDRLRAAGLDPDRPPRTWSETLAYSKALTIVDEHGRLIQAGFLPNYGNSWLYLFAFQNNSSFMSADGRTCTLDSPEAEEALKFMVDGYDILGGYEEAEKFKNGFRNNEFDPFYTGQVAMKIDGDWIMANFLRYAKNLDFGVAMPPVPDDRYYKRGRFANEKDQFVTWAGGYCYAIPNGARNVEGAWKLVKWLGSTEARLLDFTAQADWERRRGREFVPRILANSDANAKAFELLSPTSPNVRAALRLHIDAAQFARIRPVTFVGQILWDEHIRATDQACLKKKSPHDALVDGQSVVQQNLDQFFGQDQFPIVPAWIPPTIGAASVLLSILGLVILVKKRNLAKRERFETKWGYILISPWLFGFFVFTLGPMMASLFFSFTQYDVLSAPRWVGAKNYTDVFYLDQANIIKSFYNVLYLGGIGVPLSIMTGLSVAMLLNQGVRGLRFYRTMFYMPAIVPTIASTILWIYILSPDPTRGLVNSLWLSTITQAFGVAPPGWTSVDSWAKPALLAMGLWGAGSGMILWLAGLKGIPQSLYESASIDGASPWKQFFSITLPQISSLILFSTVMGFIGAIQEFDKVYVVSAGANAGPNDTMLTPVFHLFTNGFNYFKMGYASALAWIIFLVILIITGMQWKLSKRWVYEEVSK